MRRNAGSDERGCTLASDAVEMLTREPMQRAHAITSPGRRVSWFAVCVATISLLSACRGDDVVPDVFVDPVHCAHAPGEMPTICDVTDVTDAASE